MNSTIVNAQTTHHAECALLRVSPETAGKLQARMGSVPFAYPAKNAAKPGLSAYGIGVRITSLDRAIIRRFFGEGGLAPKTSIVEQPALNQKSRRLSLRSRMEALPGELEYRLSALSAGYRRVLVDSDVLLIEAATRKVVDVMRNAAASA